MRTPHRETPAPSWSLSLLSAPAPRVWLDRLLQRHCNACLAITPSITNIKGVWVRQHLAWNVSKMQRGGDLKLVQQSGCHSGSAPAHRSLCLQPGHLSWQGLRKLHFARWFGHFEPLTVQTGWFSVLVPLTSLQGEGTLRQSSMTTQSCVSKQSDTTT